MSKRTQVPSPPAICWCSSKSALPLCDSFGRPALFRPVRAARALKSQTFRGNDDDQDL